MVRWFGQSWGAPICAADNFAATPVGAQCPQCGARIEAGDHGLLIPCAGEGLPTDLAWHLPCFLKSVGIPQTVGIPHPMTIRELLALPKDDE